MVILEKTLDCGQIDSLPALHGALRSLLPLPSHYRENFDALYDCLTELSRPIRLEIRNLSQSGLGRYGTVLRRVLQDAAAQNPNFTAVFIESA